MDDYPPPPMEEPPPCDFDSSQEEDSQEFATPAAFKLDLASSADPSPLSTPRKTLKTEDSGPSFPSPSPLSKGDRIDDGEEYVECSPQEDFPTSEDNNEFRSLSDEDEDELVLPEVPTELPPDPEDFGKDKDVDPNHTAGPAEPDAIQNSFVQAKAEIPFFNNGKPEELPVSENSADLDESHDQGPTATQNQHEEQDEFSDFQADFTTPFSEEGGKDNENLGHEEFDDDDDDDFGDFESTNIPIRPVEESTDANKPVVTNDEDDDFGDFADFTEVPIPGPSASTSTPMSTPRQSADFSAALESKFDSLIKSVIPPCPVEPECEPSTPFVSLDKVLVDEKDACWSHTVDFESSRSLLHKWANCSFQQMLYRSLNIDTSTIVYTEKWGVIEVPRFAASMVETPILQPQVCSSPIKPNVQLPLVPQSTGPSPSTGDCHPITNGKVLSQEAQEIIQRIPDISFMTSKTLVFPQRGTASDSLL